MVCIVHDCHIEILLIFVSSCFLKFRIKPLLLVLLITEIGVLLLRSLFPVHPIAAAIQSIGVIRRDLEGDTSVGLGRIILPAVLLHGSFDFVLMFLSSLDSIHWYEHMPDDTEEAKEYEQELQDEQSNVWKGALNDWPSLLIGLIFVALGIVYFIVQTRAQRKRIAEMELGRRQGASLQISETEWSVV